MIIACAYVSSEGDNDHYNQINKQIYLFQYPVYDGVHNGKKPIVN